MAAGEHNTRTHPIAPVEYPREAPGPVLERLHIHDFDQKQVPRPGALDVKGPREVMDAGEVDVLHIVGRVVVLDLAARPICV